MPDDYGNVWVDTTFNLVDGATEDVQEDIYFASPENIGSYSMPIIYSPEEATESTINAWIVYFHELTTESGIENVSGEYFSYIQDLQDTVITSIIEFSTNTTTSGTDVTEVIYTTGFNSISGTLNKAVAFIAGRNMLEVDNIPAFFETSSSISGSLDWIVNHTNFSGDLETDDTPIPFHTSAFDYITEYGDTFDGYNYGALNETIDISFAGWVDFPVLSEVYSVLYKIGKTYRSEITTISGTISPHYLEMFSCVVTSESLNNDIYCALTDYNSVDFEVGLTPGRVWFIENDVYSTFLSQNELVLDIDLFPIKIFNFQPDIGNYTTSSGNISVDIVDDECAITISGTYFKVNDQIVPVTFSGIDDGYRMFYDPEDDFISIEGPTVFTAHAEDDCGNMLEEDFYLAFGYLLKYTNTASAWDSIDYGFDNKVAVRVSAENYATCPTADALAWEFESVPYFNSDLSASIVGRFKAKGDSDFSAKIYPVSTAYFYEKEFRVVVTSRDFAGNEMEPLVLTYRIEDKPNVS